MASLFRGTIPSARMSSAQIYDMLQRQVKAEGGGCDGMGLRGGRRMGGAIGGAEAEGGLFSPQSRAALQEYAVFRSAHKGVGREALKSMWAEHKRNNGVGRPVQYSVDDVYEAEGAGRRSRGAALGRRPAGGLMLGAPSVYGGFAGQRAVFAKIKKDNPYAGPDELKQLRAQARLVAEAGNAAAGVVHHAPKAVNAEWREAVVRRAKDSCKEARQIAEGKDPYHHMAATARKAAAHAVITSPVAEAHPEIAQQLLSDLADKELDELYAEMEVAPPAAPRRRKKKQPVR